MQVKEKIDYELEYSKKIQLLFGLEEIDVKKNFERFNFTKEDIPELTKLALDTRSEELDYELYSEEVDRLYFASLNAVIALGKLGAIEVIKPLFKRMYLDPDDYDYHEAIIDYLEYIGIEAIDVIENELFNVSQDKLSLFDGLEKIVENNPQEKERVSEFLARYLKQTNDNESHLGFAIALLVRFGGVKYIDIIRETFKTKDVDPMFVGDLEDVEIKLGLREKRTKPRKRNLFDEMTDMIESEIDKISIHPPRTKPKIGRNEPCPCGSGKKYKKCCLNK